MSDYDSTKKEAQNVFARRVFALVQCDTGHDDVSSQGVQCIHAIIIDQIHYFRST